MAESSASEYADFVTPTSVLLSEELWIDNLSFSIRCSNHPHAEYELFVLVRGRLATIGNTNLAPLDGTLVCDWNRLVQVRLGVLAPCELLGDTGEIEGPIELGFVAGGLLEEPQITAALRLGSPIGQPDA